MPLSKINQEAVQRINEANENLPSLVIYGRSIHTKSSTFKMFNEFTDMYGVIADFKSSKKTGLKFFITVAEGKFLLLIKQLKNANCLLIESTTDNRLKLKTTQEQMLNIVINVQVN